MSQDRDIDTFCDCDECSAKNDRRGGWRPIICDRFEFVDEGSCNDGSHTCEMRHAQDGEYVRYADLTKAVGAEREACLSIATRLTDCEEIAAAIRARGQ